MMEKITVALPKKTTRNVDIQKISVYVSLGFTLIYLFIGVLMLHTERYRSSGIHDNDLFFQADSHYAVDNLTQSTSHYKRVHLHPNFVIMFNPIGHIINSVIHQPQLTASIVCAIFGGINIGLLIYFFTLLKLPHQWSLSFGIVFGLSSTQLVFSSVPDTYIFSATGVILLLIAGLKKWKIQYWALITVYLLGITITNIVPAVLATFFFVFSGRIQQVWEQRAKVLQYCTITAGVTIVLSLLQKFFFDLWIFSFLQRAPKEQSFMFIPHSFPEAMHRVVALAEHFFVFNIIAPLSSLVDHTLREGIQLLSFQNASLATYSTIGSITLLLWLMFLGIGVRLTIKYKLYQLLFVKACVLILLFHFVLHFLYGDDLMLYSAHWTAIVFGLGAYILKSSRFFEKHPAIPLVVPVFFCVLLAINDSYLIYDMVMAFHK
ncbi:MAG: hypothetical protein RIG62_21885 [Cyclobacteriaceae bacterium]